jgi:hypothetical protein
MIIKLGDKSYKIIVVFSCMTKRGTIVSVRANRESVFVVGEDHLPIDCVYINVLPFHDLIIYSKYVIMSLYEIILEQNASLYFG